MHIIVHAVIVFIVIDVIKNSFIGALNYDVTM